MAKLTDAQKDRLKSSQFVFPENRSYPIPDKGHAQWAVKVGAIQLSKGNLTVSQYNTIAKTVNKRYGFHVKLKSSSSTRMRKG
jgi:hypothetical protein